MSLDIIISTLSADATSSIYILSCWQLTSTQVVMRSASRRESIMYVQGMTPSAAPKLKCSPFDGRDRVELILSHQEPGNLLVGNKSLTALCRVLVLKAYPALNVYVNARG